MKRFLSVFLTMILLLSCCAAATGENAATIDFSGMEMPKLSKDSSGGKISLKEENAFAIAEGKDTVRVTGTMVTVQSGDIIMMLDVPDAYLCFTQDYNASIRSYMILSEPDLLQNYMVEANSHFYLFDQYTLNESEIVTLERIPLFVLIGNLKDLNETDQNDFATAFGTVNGMTCSDIFRTDTAAWIHYTGDFNVYITIVGGECLAFYCGDADDEDAREILSALYLFS